MVDTRFLVSAVNLAIVVTARKYLKWQGTTDLVDMDTGADHTDTGVEGGDCVQAQELLQGYGQ